MTTIVDLDTGQVLGIVDGRDSEGVRDWLFARPLQWRLGEQVVAIDTPLFQSTRITWSNSVATCSPKSDSASPSRSMAGGGVPLIRSGPIGDYSCAPVTLSDRARDRLRNVFKTDDATGKLQAAWLVKEQLRALLTTGSLADAAAAKDRLQVLGRASRAVGDEPVLAHGLSMVEKIEVLIVTGATTAKVEANNTAIKHIKSTGRGFTNARNYKRVSYCAVPPEQRHEHPSRQNVHHEP
ncbi:transposase [Pseudarthrobacter sp. NPDC058196]|uniref:transposase n=1 Tax=Pseudarthrobacter sp. NPDC058196 TaxID=3346376 RepID=UPI0036DBB73D